MERIIGMLMVGLLGFLGCSDGNDGTIAVGKATPVAPWAIIETPTPTYEWTPVPGATKYRLVVSESSQASSPQDKTEATTIQDSNETAVIDEWYTAEEAECASEDEGLCMVTPDIEVFEEYTWKVRACVNDECGMWTEEVGFRVTPPGSAGAPRFTDNGDDTVTDNNTKLIWLKNANPCGVKNWWDADHYFHGLTLANHSDWRLPAIGELRSLCVTTTDQYGTWPELPQGHPFYNVKGMYWSSTAYVPDPSQYAWAMFTYQGHADRVGTFHSYYWVWPVRSGK